MRELLRLQSLKTKAIQLSTSPHTHELVREDISRLVTAIEKNIEALEGLVAVDLTLAEVEDAGIRHDLRNHIGITLGYAELIKDTADAENLTFTASLSNLLDKTVMWSKRALDQLEKRKRYSSTTVNEPAARRLESLPLDDTQGSVLILDDERANRDLLTRYVEQLKLSAFPCENAEQLFNTLSDKKIDLILLDLIMPESSGYEVLEKLKQSSSWRSIPVIVISGLGDQNEVIRCINAGAEDYLQKPFNKTLLQARLKAGLERKSWIDKERALSEQLEKSERFIKNTFGRYLSNEIVSNLLDNPDGLDMGGQLQTVSILMADIRGFTTISETLAPQDVVQLLNNYLGRMADIIMAHGGTVDEFIGDAILALFGAPIVSENDCTNAVSCAIEMQRQMDQVNALNKEQGLPEIRIGIGINTGEVVAGNIGSATRAKYGVVGHAVNLTSRIEDQTKPGEILVANSTLEQINKAVISGRTLQLQPKGMSDIVGVTEVLDFSLPPDEADEESSDADTQANQTKS